MADISMCMNGCDKQDKCHRWTAPADEYAQTMADFKPDESGVCEWFYDNTGRKQDG